MYSARISPASSTGCRPCESDGIGTCPSRRSRNYCKLSASMIYRIDVVTPFSFLYEKLVFVLTGSHIGEMRGSALSGSLHSLAKMQAKWQLLGDGSEFKSDLFKRVEETVRDMDAFAFTNMIWCDDNNTETFEGRGNTLTQYHPLHLHLQEFR